MEQSIFELIKNAVTKEGRLPADFALPDENPQEQVKFAPGAMLLSLPGRGRSIRSAASQRAEDRISASWRISGSAGATVSGAGRTVSETGEKQLSKDRKTTHCCAVR